jgi:hypothetical protein
MLLRWPRVFPSAHPASSKKPQIPTQNQGAAAVLPRPAVISCTPHKRRSCCPSSSPLLHCVDATKRNQTRIFGALWARRSGAPEPRSGGVRSSFTNFVTLQEHDSIRLLAPARLRPCLFGSSKRAWSKKHARGATARGTHRESRRLRPDSTVETDDAGLVHHSGSDELVIHVRLPRHRFLAAFWKGKFECESERAQRWKEGGGSQKAQIRDRDGQDEDDEIGWYAR